MKNTFLLLFVLLALSATGQKKLSPGKRGTKLQLNNDSMVQKIQKLQDSVARQMTSPDTIEIRRGAERNSQHIIELQDENRQKQKKWAIIRITIGLVLLAILIIGLLRKKRKPA